MELTRRDSLRLAALVATLLATPNLLAGCGTGSDEGSENGSVSDLDLASSDLQRRPGDASAIPDAVGSLDAVAAGLYAQLSSQPGNLVLSPYSVAVALALALNGAAGDTASEMSSVLAVTDLERFNDGLDALTQHVEGLAGSVNRRDGSSAQLALDTANALFGQRDTSWQQPFLDTLAASYGAGMHLVDYRSAAEQAREQINEWTAAQTNDKIPQILAEGTVDALTRLVLVNAIYLKAPWEEPFSARSTTKAPFHTDAGRTVSADTMTLGLKSSGYGQGDGWEAVRMLYAGGTLAMTVILPAEGSLDAVSSRVGEGALPEMLAATRPTMVRLSLPKWEFRTQAALGPVLAKLGMPIAFDPVAADFSPMTEEERLHIAAVAHEAFIAVDEEGTEAAAATAVVMGTTSMPQYQDVVVDRPFLFVIHDVENGSPLFLGRVTDPTA